jgi:uncharacterized protein
MILEGYAALFGVADLEGDVIHAGAFRASLARKTSVPMLLRHEARLVAGVWDELREDARGLFVRGRILAHEPAAALARREIACGVDGLSIGYRVEASRAHTGGGRDLHTIDLIEVSIVRTPMAPRARLVRAYHQERTLHA